jgi:hypothetical protein
MTEGMSSSSDLRPSISGQICKASLNLFEGKVFEDIPEATVKNYWKQLKIEI